MEWRAAPVGARELACACAGSRALDALKQQLHQQEELLAQRNKESQVWSLTVPHSLTRALHFRLNFSDAPCRALKTAMPWARRTSGSRQKPKT